MLLLTSGCGAGTANSASPSPEPVATPPEAPANAETPPSEVAAPVAISAEAAAAALALAVGCGDAMLDEGEDCDDGNQIDGDGCSAVCEVEAGFSCSPPIPPAPVNIVEDGSFESADSPWTFGSERYGTSRCSLGDCGFSFGAGALTGEHWVWLGGVGGATDTSFAEQTVVVPGDATSLRFALEAIRCENPTDALRVSLDGQVLFELTSANPICNASGYTTQAIDVSAFADGGAHVLRFEASTVATNTMASAFFIDDVVIESGDGAPGPSECSRVPVECLAESFDGLTGDLAGAGWSTFSTGASGLTWTTSDAAGCGGGGWSGSNVTGGAGDAACVDANALRASGVESWLCSPPVDLRNASDPSLTFLANAQGAPPAGSELFGVYVGITEPSAQSVGAYTPVLSVEANLGRFSALPGATLEAQLEAIAGQRTAYVCWRFGGDDEWYGEVDEVLVSAVGCAVVEDDLDGDGITNSNDNCITLPNGPDIPDAGGNVQLDADGDGFGNACDADFDGDCFIGQTDLDLMLAGFLTTNPLLDLDGNGIVNVRDVSRLLRQAGRPPGPSGVASCASEGISEKTAPFAISKRSVER